MDKESIQNVVFLIQKMVYNLIMVTTRQNMCTLLQFFKNLVYYIYIHICLDEKKILNT